MGAPPPRGRRACTRRGFLATAGIGLATLSTGCSGPWNGDPEGDDGTTEWTFRADDDLLTAPTVDGGRVYVGCRDKRLYAIDAGSGAEQWRFETGGRIDARPVAGDGRVFTTSADGDLHALDAASGQRSWVAGTYRTPQRGPALGPKRVFAGVKHRAHEQAPWAYSLSGFDRGNGDRAVRLDPPNAFSTPTVVGDTLYLDVRGQGVTAVDATTGRRRWTYEVAHRSVSRPTVGGDAIFVGAGKRDLYSYVHLLALERQTGEKRWAFERQEEVPARPVVGDDYVYLANGEHVRAFDVDRGIVRWHTVLEGEPIHFANGGSPALDGGTLYVGGVAGPHRHGRLVALDARTGEPLWKFDAGNAFTGPVLHDGRLLLTDGQEQAVYALSAHPKSPPPLTNDGS